MGSLRSMRRERGLSQRELADVAGVGQGTVSGIEAGRQEARPSTLQKLAVALGVEVSDLLSPEPGRPGDARSSILDPVAGGRTMGRDKVGGAADFVDPRLGISEADFPSWGFGLPAMEARADRDEVLKRFGTLEELQENLESLARARGTTEQDIRLVRRVCSPEAFAREATAPGYLDGPEGLSDPEVRAAYDRVASLLDSPGAGVGGRDLLSRLRAYFMRIDPAGLRAALGGLVVPGSRAYEEAFDRHFGFTREPEDVREEGRARVDDIAGRYPIGRRELARAAAVTNGREHRWPDETDAS